MFGIQHVFGSSYIARTQGLVERANRSVLGLLRTVINPTGTSWHEHLKPVVFALNCSEAYATGHSPYFLLHGRQPRFPMSWDIPNYDTQPKTVQEFLTKIIQAQEEAHRTMQAYQREKQLKQKEYYDRTCTDVNLTAGDIVYVHLTRLTDNMPTMKKLAKQYHGPYLILRFTTPSTVILKKLEDNVILEKSINVSRLKKGKLRENVSTWDPIPVDQLPTDDTWSYQDLPKDSFQNDNSDSGQVDTQGRDDKGSDIADNVQDTDDVQATDKATPMTPDHLDQDDQNPLITDQQDRGKASKTPKSPKDNRQVIREIQKAENIPDLGLRILVEFEDGSIQWLPPECLDQAAMDYYHCLDLPVTQGRYLRSRK